MKKIKARIERATGLVWGTYPVTDPVLSKLAVAVHLGGMVDGTYFVPTIIFRTRGFYVGRRPR